MKDRPRVKGLLSLLALIMVGAGSAWVLHPGVGLIVTGGLLWADLGQPDGRASR